MIVVSYLQHIYRRKDDDQRCLQQGHVTGLGFYESFADFISGMIEDGVMPDIPQNKQDAYGWTPTLFSPSGEEAEINAKYGGKNRPVLAKRKSAHVASHLTLFVADLDNHHDDKVKVEIDHVAEMLSAFDLSHFLYTSFSHTPAKHKVRIVVPVTRPLTPDEAFTIFTVFNDALNSQLDGSIYDPGDFLYGPPVTSDVRQKLDGQPLDVEYWLKVAEALPDEAKNAVVRHKTKRDYRAPTEDEKARSKALYESTAINDQVSINNPKFFRHEWFELADTLYCNGSHWQTMIGLLHKAWLKSDCSLTSGDMQMLQSDLDTYWCGYLSSNYCGSELHRAIRDVMRQVGSPRLTQAPTKRECDAALARRMKRLRKRK